MTNNEQLIAEAREVFAKAKHQVDVRNPMAQASMIQVAAHVPRLGDALEQTTRELDDLLRVDIPSLKEQRDEAQAKLGRVREALSFSMPNPDVSEGFGMLKDSASRTLPSFA